MPRYKLTIAYDGTSFHGWQKQEPPGEEPLRTVQGVLEEGIRSVVREPVVLQGASRTDAGVHARGQVGAFSTNTPIPLEKMSLALNARLPDDLKVMQADEVASSFDPIRDALTKGYRYGISFGTPGTHAPDLFGRHYVTSIHHELDVERMQDAATRFLGEHDFASMTRIHHGRESTIRRIDTAHVSLISPGRLQFDISGNGFLYNMVRTIAGTLIEVGRGRREPEAIDDILSSLDRQEAGPTLAPQGLCLEWVDYGDPGEGDET